MRFISSPLFPLLLGFILCGCGGEEETTKPANSINQNPVVNASADFTVTHDTAVQLTVNASDTDGEIIEYQWQQTAGESVSLANANTQSPSFTAPTVALNQNLYLVFSVTVTDDKGAQASDTLTVQVEGPIQIENRLPVVSAGDDQTVSEQSEVTLRASASDSDGTITNYLWQQLQGSSVPLSASNAELRFTSPAATEQEQTLVFQVTAIDDRGGQASASVQVSIPALEEPEDYPYAPGHFVAAKMPLQVVYPRPDDETQAHARHRWMHSRMTYEIPIGVQGGAWPFKYEIIRGPEGATIGELHGSENYGVLSVPPLASGTHVFVVRVTDQELNHVSFRWTATVDDSQFVFIDDNATTTGDGRIGQPLDTLEAWYGNSASNSAYANKIIVLRDGNYSLQGDADGIVELNSGLKTPSIIGFPGEAPVVNCARAKIFARGGNNSEDLFIAGIHWDNARRNIDDVHFFWVTDTANRATWWNNTFSNLQQSEVSVNTPAPIYISESDRPKHYVLVKHNRFANISSGLRSGGMVAVNWVKHLLIEENQVENSTARYHLYAKGTESFVSIRANTLIEGIEGTAIGLSYSNSVPVVPHDHEVCWNQVILPENSPNQALTTALTRDYEGETYNTWIYRNTFVNGSTLVRFKGAENYGTDGNVVVYEAYASYWDTSIMTTAIPNITGGASEGITDQSGRLIGDYRQRYLGTRGYEVFSGLADNND